jgi:hypothetical protein
MSCCSSSNTCACTESEGKLAEHQQQTNSNTVNNDDDFFGDNYNDENIADREMERKTLNRLMQTARNRGKMDETQRMEVEITRKAFCEGFTAGVDEGKLAIAKFQKK